MSEKFNAKYVRMPELVERFGVCRQTIMRWSANGDFPKPVRFNLRTVLWIRAEVEQHEQALDKAREV